MTATKMMPNTLPLKNVRVVELCRYLAGPYLGSLLGSLGAEVIKVESFKRPEWFRTAYRGRWHSLNFNKLSISLDLYQPEAMEPLKRLIEISDVVTESFRPGMIEKMGLGYESMKKVNPAIILCSFSGWGQTGPKRDKPGFAPTFALDGGISSLTGYFEEGTATEIRGSMDIRSALRCAFAILASLFFRSRTGVGQHIDVSGQEVATSCIGEKIIGYQMNGREPVPQGNRDDHMAPHNCYRCKGEDEWVSIAVSSDEEWGGLCKAMGMPELEADERMSNGLSRWENQGILDKIIESWTCQHTKYEVTDILQGAGVAAIPSFSNADLFNNEHLKARGFIKNVRHPTEGEILDFGLPWTFNGMSVPISIYGPDIGQHNDYVFRELLGLSVKEIARLKSIGVIDVVEDK